MNREEQGKHPKLGFQGTPVGNQKPSAALA